MSEPSSSGGIKDLYVAAGAKVMLESARVAMDEHAREIFDLWFGGTAPKEVVFDNPKWASYMAAEPNLKRQIRERLAEHAEQLRNQVDQSDFGLHGSLSLTFHGEAGSKQGGFRSGYDVLHGTNKSVGDLGVTGFYTTFRPGPPGTAYLVTYDSMTYVFNDIVDINKRWSADVTLGRTAQNMARALGAPPPKDYTLRIKWRSDGPIRVDVEGTPADSFHPPARTF